MARMPSKCFQRGRGSNSATKDMRDLPGSKNEGSVYRRGRRTDCMAFLLLNREEIANLLPMDECIDVMADALRSLARGEAVQPLRSVYWMPDRHGVLAVMPGMLGLPGDPGDAGAQSLIAGVKVLTVIPDNRLHGEESHQGMVLLFEAERGKPVALLDATALTAIRTAAASAAATRALAREDAGDLAILGAGTQGRSHLDAMAA